MHNTIIAPECFQKCTGGYSLDVFLCAYARVENWGEPSLRNSFWRCYLPVTEGAAVQSANRSWPMRCRYGLVIPPDCPVRGHANVPFTLFYIHFNCSIRLNCPYPRSFAIEPLLIERLCQSTQQAGQSAFRAATLELAASAMSTIPGSMMHAPIRDKRIDDALRIMKENLGQVLKNSDLARELKMSEASLLRLFHANLGISPGREHLRMRLHHAASLLQKSGHSIDEIADKCGFWDRNHFTRAFTREWQMPPARYRNSPNPL